MACLRSRLGEPSSTSAARRSPNRISTNRSINCLIALGLFGSRAAG
ncbi:hypothetical protein FAES_4366 [Fibrella aestuarina BUZ 2]|uniref:Uncharacterized protein n=1 Tax=Fibrella aestuarina BUZ 2 TaxID=1166018 RepID=I0KE12_9BACT|nr:hypothetical protein [Fibrella aestuarina]CCH02365.1 hypothetical protein FAES_4366 [Fibrella aestuarina BUZ 2]